tara:strand:+ start:180 stop:1256 length:1077 start_codon:yes stop_codon:yes gene_type:complete
MTGKKQKGEDKAVGSFKKINDPARLDQYQRKVAEKEGKVDGVACTWMNEPIPYYNDAGAETIYESSRRTARIVLGVDRPGNRLTGYGGMGHSLCGMIDMVAGPSGHAARAVTIKSKNPIPDRRISQADVLTSKSTLKALRKFDIEPLYADPHPVLDAARVKIVQKSNVDIDYNLPQGTIGNDFWPRSFVLAKADGIRMVSRDAGIKLITGADMDAKNSQGEGWSSYNGIELIAGNNSTPETKWEVQPLAKGENLRKFLIEVMLTINEVVNVIDNLIQVQNSYNNALMFHGHVTTVPGTMVSFSPDALPAGIAQNLGYLMKTIFPSLLVRVNILSRMFKHLMPVFSGKNYILSYYNKTN